MFNENWQLDQLVAVMGELYPVVLYVSFCKVYREDGTIFRDGYTDNIPFPFSVAMNEEIMSRRKQRALERFAPRIREQFGREPKIDEIRLAFRPDQAFFHSVFVDDVTGQTKAHILIETSPGNWQAHFILDKEVTIDVAADIQKFLIANSIGTSRPTADPASASPKQARRFPEGRFIHDTMLPKLNVDEILAKIKIVEHEKRQATSINCKIKHQSREEHWDDESLGQVYSRQLKRIYDNKKAKDKSYSAVDLAFVMYMVGHCELDVDFVKESLKKVSPNIERRHPQLDYYLRRTLEKALQYIENK